MPNDDATVHSANDAAPATDRKKVRGLYDTSARNSVHAEESRRFDRDTWTKSTPMWSVLPLASLQSVLMNNADFGLLVLRLTIGLFLAYHGYNKIFGGGGLKGTASWFGSIGMKAPQMQARLAAGTEIIAGLAFAAGLMTPLSGAAIIGTMIVAIITVHGRVGFFIFLPNQGWEYCGMIALAAFSVSAIGPGKVSVDHLLDYHYTWAGTIIAAIVGIGSAVLQLATFYRPSRNSDS